MPLPQPTKVTILRQNRTKTLRVVEATYPSGAVLVEVQRYDSQERRYAGLSDYMGAGAVASAVALYDNCEVLRRLCAGE